MNSIFPPLVFPVSTQFPPPPHFMCHPSSHLHEDVNGLGVNGPVSITLRSKPGARGRKLD